MIPPINTTTPKYKYVTSNSVPVLSDTNSSPNIPNSGKYPNFNYSGKYPNFNYGETLNPYCKSPPVSASDPKPLSPPHLTSIQNPIPSKYTTSFLDPLLPPVVKLTSLSAEDVEGRYILSRLRDKKIYADVRLYLAYLHDKPDSICVDGLTRTYLKVKIHQEGLPTDTATLKQLFYRYHELSGEISPQQLDNDLSTFGSHVGSKRISQLQKSRTDHKNYFRS